MVRRSPGATRMTPGLINGLSTTRQTRSVPDLEVCESWIRIDLPGFDQCHRGAAGPSVKERHELIDGVGCSLSPDSNGPVGLVRNPPCHA